jgi:serine/arginine repetitive matrix protein 2
LVETSLPPIMQSQTITLEEPISLFRRSSSSSQFDGKLPTNREGVKKWLSAKGLFPPQSSQPSYPSLQQPVPASVVIPHSGSTDVNRKSSLSDQFDVRKEGEPMTDWEDMSTTTNDDNATQVGESQSRPGPRIRQPSGVSSTPGTPAQDKPPYDSARVQASNGDAQSVTYPSQSISPAPDDTSAMPDPINQRVCEYFHNSPLLHLIN